MSTFDPSTLPSPTFLTPQVIPVIFGELRAVYGGPVVQTQGLTVFNVTRGAIVARQAQVVDELPPIAGEQRADWSADALIPLDDVEGTPGSDRA